jgi:hypothetical protein
MNPRRARLRKLPTFADMARAFGAIDAMLVRLGEGWTHAIQGEPVFRNGADETWYSMPPALDGWVALWARIDTRYRLGLDLDPVRQIARRLAVGTAIDPALVARGVSTVTACKRHYRKMDVYAIGAIVKTEMIAQRAEELGLTGESA